MSPEKRHRTIGKVKEGRKRNKERKTMNMRSPSEETEESEGQDQTKGRQKWAQERQRLKGFWQR